MRDDTSTAERSPERVLAAYRRFPVIYIAGPYTAGVDVIRAYRSLDHHVGRSIQAVTFAEIRWSELMRSWMAARGIAQTDDEAAR